MCAWQLLSLMTGSPEAHVSSRQQELPSVWVSLVGDRAHFGLKVSEVVTFEKWSWASWLGNGQRQGKEIPYLLKKVSRDRQPVSGNMAQLVKCLPYKQQDLSSVPNLHCESSAEGWGGDRGIPRACWPASLASEFSFQWEVLYPPKKVVYIVSSSLAKPAQWDPAHPKFYSKKDTTRFF